MFVSSGNTVSTPEKTGSKYGASTQALFVCFIGLIMVGLIITKYNIDISALKDKFQTSASKEADAVSEVITQRFIYLHEGLSTIAQLQSVRSIYEVPRGLDKQAKQSIDQLYNLLFSFIKLSEIYVVPADFDPKSVDPETGLLQTPTVAFDHKISGRDARQTGTLEEIEFYEYEQMKTHLDWFKSNFPDRSSVSGYNYPALISKEVITCDNSFFSQDQPDNKQRSGLIYSVPFFDSQGQLAGSVAGVILCNVLMELLPNERYAIRNITHDYNVTKSAKSLRDPRFMQWVNSSLPAPDLVYSENISLALPDDLGSWNLWVGANNEEFWNQEQVKSTQLFTILALIATVLLSISITSIVVLQAKQRRMMRQQNINLEEMVSHRTVALQQSEARARAILDNAADGIVILDNQGSIEVFNKAAESMFGYTAQRVMNTHISNLIPELNDKVLGKQLNNLNKSQSRRPNQQEFIGRREDSSEFILELHINEVQVKDHSLVTGIFRDISDRKQTEQAITLAKEEAEQATQAKSDFLANMSHELRTPLNAIIGYAELLKDDFDQQDTQQTNDVDHILSAGNQLLHLVNGILDLSKIEAGKMELHLEKFDINTLIDSVIDSLKPIIDKNGNQILCKLAPNTPNIDADRIKVRQIIINLISNANKFTQSGTITVIAEQRLRCGIEWLFISVADTGIGMSSEQLVNIFNKFTQGDSSTTKKYGGTGLGLSISQHFCEMMGGIIEAESIPNIGTEISVHLPMEVIGPKVDPVMIRFQDCAEDVRSRRIKISRVLIIGDNSLSRDLMDRFLSREGFFTDTVSSANQALVVAAKHPPDIIVIDENSLTFDSWGSINQIKTHESLASIPIIMLTKSDSKQMAQALGANDYLSKPIERSELIKIVTRYIRDDKNRKRNHVLVIDDNKVNSSLLKRMLEVEGITVVTAENGQEGLDRVEETEPALIFLDIIMPVMDGFEFAEKLRSNPKWRNIPIITVTGYDLSNEQKQRLTGYVDTILNKQDLEPAVLLNKMRSALVSHLRKSQQDHET